MLYGQGIGRYSSSQLADVVIGPNGSLKPITSIQFLVGAVVHPFAGTDVYAYYGQDKTQSNAWTVGGVQGGWGNGAFPEACGALIPGSTDTVGFNAGSGVCAANVQRVQEFTVGFWQDIYKGDLGRARIGLQYEYVTLDLFAGATAIPAGNGLTAARPRRRPTPVCTRTTTSSSSRSATIPSTKRNVARKNRQAPSAQTGGAFVFMENSLCGCKGARG